MIRDGILTFLRTHKQEIQLNYGVAAIGFFGSYARQAARNDSDIDILVEFQAEKKTLRNFFGYKRSLEKNLEKSVDLGVESALKPMVHETRKKMLSMPERHHQLYLTCMLAFLSVTVTYCFYKRRLSE